MESEGQSKEWRKSSNNCNYTNKSKRRTKRRKKMKYKVKRRVKKLSTEMPETKPVNGRSIYSHSQQPKLSSHNIQEVGILRPIPPIPPPPPPKIPMKHILNRGPDKQVETTLVSPPFSRSKPIVSIPEPGYEPKPLQSYKGKPLHKMLQRFKHPVKRKARTLIIDMGRPHSLNSSSKGGTQKATEGPTFLSKDSKISTINYSSDISRPNRKMWLSLQDEAFNNSECTTNRSYATTDDSTSERSSTG